MISMQRNIMLDYKRERRQKSLKKIIAHNYYIDELL